MTTIPLPAWEQGPPLRQNDRRAWVVQWRAFQQAKEAAAFMIRAARPAPMIRAEVVLHWQIRDARLRDSDGLAPSLKACLDALVLVGVLPADDWRHVPFSGHRIHPPTKKEPGAMWIALKEVAA